MPPSETNQAVTPLQQPPNVPPGKRHFGLLITVIVAGILLLCVALAWFIFLRFRAGFNAKNVNNLNTETIVKYFPNFGSIVVKPDPIDSRYLWLFGQAGIMRVDTESQEIVDYAGKIPGIKNRSLSDLVRVGEKLFIGFQGGLIDYNLNTKTSKQYSTADGLASSSNIALNPDPSDSDILWISTFEGLSKLTISSGRIQSFTAEIGISGTTWQPRVFHVDDKYVWLTISANAYTTGGIARLDKRTGVWKSWGYELFHYGRTPSRFDTYGAAADGDRAIVEEDGIIYSYNLTKDEWLPITTYHQSDPVKREITLKGTTAYFWSGTLKELNIDTAVERDLLQPSMFANAGISFDKFSKALLRIEFDESHGRLILYPQSVSSNTGIGILSLKNKNLPVVPFKDFEKINGLELYKIGLKPAP